MVQPVHSKCITFLGSNPRSLTKKEIIIVKTALLCLALNIYFEARGEPIYGQYAVAHVTINRSKLHKTSICHEVFKKNQFSWTKYKYSIPPKNDKVWFQALIIAKKALRSNDITNGALYFNHNRIKRSFKYRPIKQIGNHTFYTLRYQ